MKHYFLLDNGDWFVHFMDTAHEELCKDTKSINLPRLESMLSLSLVTSIANNDLYKDGLTCTLMNSSALDEVRFVSSSSLPWSLAACSHIINASS